MWIPSFGKFGELESVLGTRSQRRLVHPGGLISVWNEAVLVVEDVLQEQRVLAIKVKGVNDDFVWAFANVHGPNVEADTG